LCAGNDLLVELVGTETLSVADVDRSVDLFSGWAGCKGADASCFLLCLSSALLWQTKQWRSLFHPAHFIGIFVMLAIFAAWAIPFIEMTVGERVMN